MPLLDRLPERLPSRLLDGDDPTEAKPLGTTRGLFISIPSCADGAALASLAAARLLSSSSAALLVASTAAAAAATAAIVYPAISPGFKPGLTGSTGT